MEQSVDYHTAETKDFPAILDLNRKYLRQGKLLWKLGRSDLANYLNKSHSIVAKTQEEVIGCLATFDLEAKTSQLKDIAATFKQIISPKVLQKINVCMGQLFVREGHMGRGIAFNLYREFFNANQDYDLRVMDIDPDYPPSLRLHSKKLCLPKIWNSPERFIFAGELKKSSILSGEISRLVQNVLSNSDSAIPKNSEKSP